MSKQRLGKGLQALITDMSPSASDEIQDIAIDSVMPNPYQPRRVFSEDQLAELAESIRQHGIIQPVTVRKRSGYYELVVGERRLRAAKLAGLSEIRAFVRDMSDLEMMEVALIENLQREDLNPMDEATALKQMQEALGYTQELLAQRIGKSRPYVANALRLLSLPKEVAEYVSRGTLSAGHARAVLAVPETQREIFAAKLLEQGLTVRQAEELAQGYTRSVSRETSTPKPKATLTLEMREVERRLRDSLQAKVQISSRGKRGLIQIEYYGTEELERLLEIFAAGSQLIR